MFNSLPLGIGQYHLFHELLKANPRLAIIILALIVILAIYLNQRH
ncbi:hypothetical protein ACLUWZ_00900 [Limosilactobacillus mucosae]